MCKMQPTQGMVTMIKKFLDDFRVEFNPKYNWKCCGPNLSAKGRDARSNLKFGLKLAPRSTNSGEPYQPKLKKKLN